LRAKERQKRKNSIEIGSSVWQLREKRRVVYITTLPDKEGAKGKTSLYIARKATKTIRKTEEKQGGKGLDNLWGAQSIYILE
jgi:hypothetical protein